MERPQNGNAAVSGPVATARLILAPTVRGRRLRRDPKITL
jgi:hypothetical protein